MTERARARTAIFTATCPLGHKTTRKLWYRFEDDETTYKLIATREGIECQHCEHDVLVESIRVRENHPS